MRSSTGQHFAGLDHLRALAAFLVILWHFAHNGDHPVPLAQAPEIGLFDEGHCGVALFMTLSGYLFAKLISGNRINYAAFYWNRVLRLCPLLILMLGVTWAFDYPHDAIGFLRAVVGGLVLPTMPHGAWSIIVELHFYILLPLILSITRRWPLAPLLISAGAIMLRAFLLDQGWAGDYLGYTILGRIDQFVLGVFFFIRPASGRQAAFFVACLWLFYGWFTAGGGFYAEHGVLTWSVLPTFEALGFGALIAWYDENPFSSWWLWPVQKAGEYSYGIYLIHFFLVAVVADYVDENVMKLTSIYIAIPWALLFFSYMTLLGWISYRFLEEPFLRLRKPYFQAPVSSESTDDVTLSMHTSAPA